MNFPDIIVAKNKKHLHSLIQNSIDYNGLKCDLNHIDVSNITDMEYLFAEYNFNGNISKWDTSNVTNMSNMFSDSVFNGDISKWNTSNVTEMYSMFRNSKFNRDISQWDVSNVINMRYMFSESKFKNNLTKWNIGNNCDIQDMFYCGNHPKEGMLFWHLVYTGETTQINKKQKEHFLKIQPIIETLQIDNFAAARYLHQTFTDKNYPNNFIYSFS